MRQSPIDRKKIHFLLVRRSAQGFQFAPPLHRTPCRPQFALWYSDFFSQLTPFNCIEWNYAKNLSLTTSPSSESTAHQRCLMRENWTTHFPHELKKLNVFFWVSHKSGEIFSFFILDHWNFSFFRVTIVNLFRFFEKKTRKLSNAINK